MDEDNPYAQNDNPYASPENDEAPAPRQTGDLNLADRATRLVAVIVEGIIVSIPLFFVAMLAAVTGPGGGQETMFLLLFVVILIYLLINLRFIFKYQQTIGKRIMNIKVVRTDGSPCSGARYLFLRIILIQIMAGVPFIGGIFALLDPLMIFRESRQCLHDNIADTIVVKC